MPARFFLLASSILGALIGTAPGEVRPCSCFPRPTPLEALEEAAAVFRGQVTAVEAVADLDHRVSFGVTVVWKGPIEETIDIRTPNQSAACGVAFEVGSDYLVYAYQGAEESYFTHLCSRTDPYRIEEAAALGPPIWEKSEATSFQRGDSNADTLLDLSDAVFLLGHLFSGEYIPPCPKAADSDDNGALEITDAIHLLTYLFLSGPPPPEPFPSCGWDSGTPDDLGCLFSPACA